MFATDAGGVGTRGTRAMVTAMMTKRNPAPPGPRGVPFQRLRERGRRRGKGGTEAGKKSGRLPGDGPSRNVGTSSVFGRRDGGILGPSAPGPSPSVKGTEIPPAPAGRLGAWTWMP